VDQSYPYVLNEFLCLYLCDTDKLCLYFDKICEFAYERSESLYIRVLITHLFLYSMHIFSFIAMAHYQCMWIKACSLFTCKFVVH